LAGSGGEKSTVALTADEREPNHLGVVIDRPLDIGRFKRRMTDPQHIDHRVLLLLPNHQID
jgi:hypothetical protein